MSDKPRPNPRGEEAAWFAGALDHQLLYQRCGTCLQTAGYLRAVCPHCGSVAVSYEQAAGGGSVHSWTTQEVPGGPGFAEDVPYTLVLVDLDEGVRVLAELVGLEGEPEVGLRVGVYFDDVDENLTLPRFAPSSGAVA